MRRAKYPPHADVVAECAVIADMLALGRRDEITRFDALHLGTHDRTAPPYEQTTLLLDADAILTVLTELAMGEYLRRFPATRKMNNDPWHEDTVGAIGERETDYQCFFCRKSLNTMPIHRHPKHSSPFIQAIREHCEECGIRMLAGLMKPRPPFKRGEPGR